MGCAYTSRLLAAALAAILASACVGNPDRQTLAMLHDVEPDMTEVRVADGLDRAMLAYRSFLKEAPESALTPEAMRRLADLKLEKEYGIGAGRPAETPAQTETQPVPDRNLHARKRNYRKHFPANGR